MRNQKKALVTGLAVLALAGSGFIACQSNDGDGHRIRNQSGGMQNPDGKFYRFQGNELVRPEGYREWVFVGLPLTPNDMNNGKAAFPEFHSVYIDPTSFAHWEKTGEFRDGTILIKELLSVGSKKAVSGNGYFMGDFIGLEATIKDSKQFPNEPGNWAYFSFTNPQGGPVASRATAFDTASCNSCHAASAADDFVFTQYYPVLSASKGAGPMKRTREAFTIRSNGELVRPEGYRKWIYVGVPVTPNDMNNGKAAFPEMHNVYIDPRSYHHYLKTGEFRDGTILIKELVSVGSKKAVSGNGYFMGDFIGLEATIKSSKHFPNEPGNWAYFSFTNKDTPGGPLAERATAFPTASCNSCHDASAAEDFVFTQYYPVLGKAHGQGASMAGKTAVAEKKDDVWAPTAETPVSNLNGMPLDKQGLWGYLKAGNYNKFPSQESAAHPGRGPHTSRTSPVRVFFNKQLADSLAAGNAEHPVGSIAVKEMLDGPNGALGGWAVMAKTSQSNNPGADWFWYETTDVSSYQETVAHGNGVAGCVSCHDVSAEDMILSDHPLK